MAQETWRIQANLSTPPTLNIRYPGLYYDFETGLVQNWWRTYEPRIGRHVSADPIGLNGGWNRFAYSNQDGINQYDPYGLWAAEGPMPTPTPVPRSKPAACSCRKFSCSLEAYAGVGGGLTVTWNQGTLEIVGRLGFGLGGGFSFDPRQGRSRHAKATGNGYIARTTFSAQSDVSLGALGIGGGIAARSGNAFETPVGGGYSENSYPTLNIDEAAKIKKYGLGVRAGAFGGVELGSYSNWENECDCQK